MIQLNDGKATINSNGGKQNVPFMPLNDSVLVDDKTWAF